MQGWHAESGERVYKGLSGIVQEGVRLVVAPASPEVRSRPKGVRTGPSDDEDEGIRPAVPSEARATTSRREEVDQADGKGTETPEEQRRS